LSEVPHYSTISKEVERGRFKEVVGRECKLDVKLEVLAIDWIERGDASYYRVFYRSSIEA